MLEIRTVEYITNGEKHNYKAAYVNRADLIEKPLWFHKKGLQQTKSGYGCKLTSTHMVKHNNRLYRLYVSIFSNSGSMYIICKGERVYIDII